MDAASSVFAVDWRSMFVPSEPIAEIVMRGTFMYLALFVILRFVLKRQTGGLGISDLLVIVLIADAAQNAMAANYESVTEGAVLVLTIIFWNFAVNWLGFHVPALGRLTHPDPLLLVKDGRALPRNLRREMITADELMSQLRLHGVREIADVELAYIEGDGRMSVIERKPGGGSSQGDEGTTRRPVG